jgi:hypothetical protein
MVGQANRGITVWTLRLALPIRGQIRTDDLPVAWSLVPFDIPTRGGRLTIGSWGRGEPG